MYIPIDDKLNYPCFFKVWTLLVWFNEFKIKVHNVLTQIMKLDINIIYIPTNAILVKTTIRLQT